MVSAMLLVSGNTSRLAEPNTSRLAQPICYMQHMTAAAEALPLIRCDKASVVAIHMLHVAIKPATGFSMSHVTCLNVLRVNLDQASDYSLFVLKLMIIEQP